MPDTKRDGLPWNTVCCSCLCDISHVYAWCFFSDCIINSLYFCHTTFMGTLSFCYVTFLGDVLIQHPVATVCSPQANPGNYVAFQIYPSIFLFFFFLTDKWKTSVQQCTDISRWAVFFRRASMKVRHPLVLSILIDEVPGKENKTKERNRDILGTEHTAHISHTFSPQWLMPLWMEAEMAVARIHGKVKCRPFKEKEEEGTVYKAWHHWKWPLCFSLSSRTDPKFLFSLKVLRFRSVRGKEAVRRKRGTPFFFLFSFLPTGNRLQWLAVFKGLNLSEWALWTADPMVRQLRSYCCNLWIQLGFVSQSCIC